MISKHHAFDSALFHILHEDPGIRIQREGWSGKGLWVFLQRPDAYSKMTEPYFYLLYPDGRRCPWVPSQTDLVAQDWIVNSD